MTAPTTPKPKTKTVELNGQRYVIRKMSPNAGSFVLTRVLAAGADSGILGPDVAEGTLVSAFSAFLRGLDYATFSFIQNNCLAAVSRLEKPASGPEVAMPVVTDTGQFAISEVADDLSLVMSLTVQSLLFNLSDFFDLGGLSAALGSQSATTR